VGIGDWGLGIAQSPIPNPQSPNFTYFIFINNNNLENQMIEIFNI